MWKSVKRWGLKTSSCFGLKTEEVYALKARGYNPWDYYNGNETLRAVLDLVASGHFSPTATPTCFRPLLDNLLYSESVPAAGGLPVLHRLSGPGQPGLTGTRSTGDPACLS